jgi:hypothetical protein
MMGRQILVVATAALLLAGCSTFWKRPAPLIIPPPTPAAPAPVVVIKPAAPVITPAPPPAKQRSCVPKNFPRAPKYPDTDGALLDAGGAADRYQLMAAGRVLRALRLAELEKIVDGCR